MRQSQPLHCVRATGPRTAVADDVRIGKLLLEGRKKVGVMY